MPTAALMAARKAASRWDEIVDIGRCTLGMMGVAGGCNSAPPGECYRRARTISTTSLHGGHWRGVGGRWRFLRRRARVGELSAAANVPYVAFLRPEGRF